MASHRRGGSEAVSAPRAAHLRGRKRPERRAQLLHRTVMFSPREFMERSEDILGGTPVFRGTRVQPLVDYLEAGERLDDFLPDFPTVGREQAVGLLQLVKEVVLH